MKKTTADPSAARNADLRRMLSDRKRAIEADLQARIRDVRSDHATGVLDEIESSHAGVSGELELAFLQMKAATLRRVDEALGRLDAGDYGCCFVCGAEITEQRLRALPFAVRCTGCEARVEQGQERVRHAAAKRVAPSLFTDGTGY